MRALVAAVACALASSCDTFHGVVRTAEVETIPDPARLLPFLEGYAEIDTVHVTTLSHRPLFGGPETLHHCYRYQGGTSVQGLLVFDGVPGRSIHFHHSVGSVGFLPEHVYEATLSLMPRIEHHLEMAFGVTGLSERIEEKWINMHLPPEDLDL